jgi:hypothetical protein
MKKQPPFNPNDEGFKKYCVAQASALVERAESLALQVFSTQEDLALILESAINHMNANSDAWFEYCRDRGLVAAD